MRLFLIIISVFWCQFSLAQTTDLTVADPNLTTCIQTIARKKGWRTAESVEALTCHGKKIKSLVGIEKFSNLKRLSLHKNQIVQADVSALKKLEHLNLARNQLANLKVQDLPQLKQMFVFGNKLTTLTLKNLPQLALIKANSNQLTSFNYTQLPSLKKIHIFDNQLEDIDIYHLPKMIYMDCRQNPMPDPLYEEMDEMNGVTILHDGNAEDW